MWMTRTSWTIYLNVQQKVEEAQREKEELVKNMAILQQEKEQLEAEKESLQKEFEQEKESCAQLRKENQVSREWWIGEPTLRQKKIVCFDYKEICIFNRGLFVFMVYVPGSDFSLMLVHQNIPLNALSLMIYVLLSKFFKVQF